MWQSSNTDPVSAYDRRPLAGVVRTTWLAGKRIELDEDPRNTARPGNGVTNNADVDHAPL